MSRFYRAYPGLAGGVCAMAFCVAGLVLLPPVLWVLGDALAPIADAYEWWLMVWH